MNVRGFYTLFYKETLRFAKVWLQTLGAPVVTAVLYLMVFGHILEGRIQVFAGVSYATFLIPGLMMMSLMQNAAANSSSSLIQSKVTGNLVFLLVAPLSYLEIYLAFVLAATVRGIIVGLGVLAVGMFFVNLPIHHLGIIIVFAVLASAVLGSFGLLAGIWAEKFDQLAGMQNFIITPLTFLSGVFYSIHSLPPFWQQLSRLNPFFYMIDGFRYGFFGISDVSPWLSFAVSLAALMVLGAVSLIMLHRGYKLRD